MTLTHPRIVNQKIQPPSCHAIHFHYGFPDGLGGKHVELEDGEALNFQMLYLSEVSRGCEDVDAVPVEFLGESVADPACAALCEG